MSKSYRVAVIGCGSISGNHIDALIKEGQTVVALCDILPENAQKRAEQFGLNVPIYTDYLELLEKEKPDAVHICTPHDCHAKIAVAALDKNINVLCEKPLATTLEDYHRVVEAADRSRATFGLVLQNRWLPTMIRLREMAQNGILAGYGSVVWKRDADYYATGAWRGTKEHEGGGVMINQALHTLDILQWVCGMPAYVTARVENWHLQDTIEVEDTAVALFENADGVKTNFFATTAGGRDLPVHLEIQTKDRNTIEAGGRYLVDKTHYESDFEAKEQVGKEVWGVGHLPLIHDYYGCLEAGKPFPIDAREGGKVLRLILGMYASNGKRIAIPE